MWPQFFAANAVQGRTGRCKVRAAKWWGRSWVSQLALLCHGHAGISVFRNERPLPPKGRGLDSPE